MKNKKIFSKIHGIFLALLLVLSFLVFNNASVKAEENAESKSHSYTLSEQLSKIDYTDEELAASGWDGKTNNAAKASLYKTAFEKSDIKYYIASNYESYKQYEFYTKAYTGTNRWVYKYTHVNSKFAICDSMGEGSLTQNRINSGGRLSIYTRANSYLFYHAFSWTAPADGVLVIPEHTLEITDFQNKATALYMGWSKGTTDRAKIDPADTSLNWVEYNEKKAYVIEKQTFDVEAGDVIYLNMYSSISADGYGIVHANYNPTYVFTDANDKVLEDEVKDFTTTLCEQIGKIAYTDEELAASGWDGTNADAADKMALFKSAFEKSDLKYYAGVNPTGYALKEYYTFITPGWNAAAGALNWTNINGLSCGWHAAEDPRLTSNGSHRLYMSVSDGVNPVWTIAWTAPTDGTLTIPEHTLNNTGTPSILVGWSMDNGTRTTIDPSDESLNLVAYASGYNTIATQTFNVRKGDVVYLTMQATDGPGWMDYNPTYVFVEKMTNSVSYKLSEQIAKIGYTDEELAASGWDGTSRNANKLALYTTAFGKSDLKFYVATKYNNHKQMEYYKYCNDGSSWYMSYTHINGHCAGNSNTGLGSERLDPDGTLGIYNGSGYDFVWSIAWTAPATGTLTIPEHTLVNRWAEGATTGFKLGWSKGTASRASIAPTDSSLNLVDYATGTHTIAEQVFEVNAGDVVYLNMYSEISLTYITYDPTYIFEPETDPCKLYGHKEVVDAAVAATCTEAGKTEGKHCSVCNEVLVAQQVVLALGHTKVVDAAVAATCKEAGKTEGSHCSVCNEVLVAQQVVPALGHAFENVFAVAATCKEAGNVAHRHCSVCGLNVAFDGTINLKYDSYYQWAGSDTKLFTRTGDGTKGSFEFVYGGNWFVYLVLDSEGRIAYLIQNPANGYGDANNEWYARHSIYADYTTNPAFANLGGSIDQWGNIGFDLVVPTGGFAVMVNAGEVLLEEIFGYYTGSDRDFSHQSLNVDNIRITIDGYDNLHIIHTDAELVEIENVVVSAAHNVVVDAAVAADCENSGLTEGSHCSVCNEVIVAQTVIPALGHTKVLDAAVAADCENSGLTEGSHCSVCNEVIVAQTVVLALGHTEVVDAAVAADCENSGLTEGKHCSVCDKVLVAQEVVAALGHTEVVDAAVAADCLNAGKTEGKHCSVCNEVLVAQTTIPALGHAQVLDPSVEPTCTTAGYTKGSHCEVCGEVLKAREEIPAYGHAQVLDPSVEPTCTTAGYTKGSHCEVCGEVLKAREEIPAFAHGYNNWEHDEDYHWADCERCGETSDKIVHTMGEDEVCSKCGVSQAELDELVETNPYHPIQISESMLLVVKVIALIALLGILYKIGQFLGFYY